MGKVAIHRSNGGSFGAGSTHVEDPVKNRCVWEVAGVQLMEAALGWSQADEAAAKKCQDLRKVLNMM